jgi:flagellar M-ring protein FliF
VPTFVQSLLRLPTRTKAIVAVSAVAILAIAFLMLQVASSPSYATLAAGLAPADTGKYTSALDEAGITYELQSNGTALAVEKAQVSKARIALAGQGLAATGGTGSQEGFELFDKQKLGASDFQNKVTYQRALEGEIARTINGVQGVSGASVQLVLPEDDLFADSSTPATAAVMLSNPADAMEPGAVRGIAQLVASSVKGLKTENVTITDSSGSLLWPNGRQRGRGPGRLQQAGRRGALRPQPRGLADRDARPHARPRQGPGAGQRRPQRRQDDQERARLRQEGHPLKTTEETEKLRGKGATSGGTAGTGSNVPTYSAGSGGGSGNNSYDRKSGTTDYGVDKTVSKTEVAPGQVNKMQVALLVDKSVPAAAFTASRTRSRAPPASTPRAATSSRPSRCRSPRPRPEGRPRADEPARAAEVGRPRSGRAALLLLHGARHPPPRVRDARRARWLREIEAPVRSPSSRPVPRRRCCRRVARREHAQARPADGARARARRRPGPPVDERGLGR